SSFGTAETVIGKRCVDCSPKQRGSSPKLERSQGLPASRRPAMVAGGCPFRKGMSPGPRSRKSIRNGSTLFNGLGSAIVPPTWLGTCPGFSQQAVARTLKLRLQIVEARSPTEVAGAVSAATKGEASALLVLGGPMLFIERARIVDLAAKGRLP